MKKSLIIPILILLILTVCFASLGQDMDTVETYVNQYNSGEITAPQLVVYLDYAERKMYEQLDKTEKRAFEESEIQAVFEKNDNKDNFNKPMMPMGNEYQKVFTTDDFDVIFMAQPHFRQDKEYYEEFGEESEEYLKKIDEIIVDCAINNDFIFEANDENKKFIDEQTLICKNEYDDEGSLNKNDFNYWCECYHNKLLFIITDEDFEFFEKNDEWSDIFYKKEDSLSKACFSELR